MDDGVRTEEVEVVESKADISGDGQDVVIGETSPL